MNIYSIYKDIRLDEENIYHLQMRIDNLLYVEKFNNVVEMINFCKEKELKYILGVNI